MKILHLTSSRFYGGPERQMLGLAQAMQGQSQTVFASFLEDGLNQAFLSEVGKQGFTGISLENDTPKLLAARRELIDLIQKHSIDVIVCHGYKAGMIGWLAARATKIPAIAVSRGWTAEDWKVKLYERLDRFMLRRMQKVVCVSQGQAQKVIHSGVSSDRTVVIRNAVFCERFQNPNQEFRTQLVKLFPDHMQNKLKYIVGAAGRLSPEKGFDLFIEAAQKVITERSDVGFVLFGDGSLKEMLTERIRRAGVADRFCLAGFTRQLDSFMPHFDLFVQSSHTEGLPNVLLESMAAGVPVVATDVGGTSELVTDNVHGRIVPPGDAEALAEPICDLLKDEKQRTEMSQTGTVWVHDEFSFDQQASHYLSLLESLTAKKPFNRTTEFHSATTCR